MGRKLTRMWYDPKKAKKKAKPKATPKKVTTYLLPEVKPILRGLGYRTTTAGLNSLVLLVGRQAGLIEGVEPLVPEEFLRRILRKENHELDEALQDSEQANRPSG
jgi:hypothetical protein